MHIFVRILKILVENDDALDFIILRGTNINLGGLVLQFPVLRYCFGASIISCVKIFILLTPLVYDRIKTRLYGRRRSVDLHTTSPT
jgi:hypothetical protein